MTTTHTRSVLPAGLAELRPGTLHIMARQPLLSVLPTVTRNGPPPDGQRPTPKKPCRHPVPRLASNADEQFHDVLVHGVTCVLPLATKLALDPHPVMTAIERADAAEEPTP